MRAYCASKLPLPPAVFVDARLTIAKEISISPDVTPEDSYCPSMTASKRALENVHTLRLLLAQNCTIGTRMAHARTSVPTHLVSDDGRGGLELHTARLDRHRMRDARQRTECARRLRHKTHAVGPGRLVRWRC